MSGRAPARRGACPRCARPIGRADLIHGGILHGREASRGGPYYTLQCPRCRLRLVGRPMGGDVLLEREPERAESRLDLGRLLRALLGRDEENPGRVPPRVKEAASRRPRGSRSRPAAVVARLRELGLGADADFAQVRRAFVRIVRQTHPDVTRRLDPEERRRREERFRSALEAYRELERRLGEQ